MILNIPALQYSLFGNIQKKLIDNGTLKPGEFLQVFPTICPSPKFFEDMGISNPIQYAKFISSAYRIDLGSIVFYFFFRNKKAESSAYVIPSSVEVVAYDTRTKLKVLMMKNHYCGQDPDCLMKTDSVEFDDKLTMMSAVSSLAVNLADNFVRRL